MLLTTTDLPEYCLGLAAMFIKNEDGLTIPPGWREFLQRLRDDQLAALQRLREIWSGVTARYIRVRRQLAARNRL